MILLTSFRSIESQPYSDNLGSASHTGTLPRVYSSLVHAQTPPAGEVGGVWAREARLLIDRQRGRHLVCVHDTMASLMKRKSVNSSPAASSVSGEEITNLCRGRDGY